MEEGVVDIKNKKYPKALKEIKNPPKRLYYRGNWDEDIFENCLAVVGSRRMTSYGRRIAEKMVRDIASAGITIVSGFMYGIDATSHRASLDGGGRTIAVMPCGVNIVHPEYQGELYDDILKNKGLIISEFEKDFPPDIWTYPKRNRIVAGLSKSTFVVEAALKSGSLITAGFAKKYKRRIFALPGPTSSNVSEGTNRLIKDGASIVTCAQDILDFYDIKKSDSNNLNFQKAEGLEKKILEILKREPMEIDALSRMFEIPSSKIGTILSLMTMKGLISQEGGKYIANY